MSKSSEKAKGESNTVVSPARYTQQPVSLYSRHLQMKADNKPRILRQKAIGTDPVSFVYPKLDVVEADDPSKKEADATILSFTDNYESGLMPAISGDEKEGKRFRHQGKVTVKGEADILTHLYGNGGDALSSRMLNYIRKQVG